MTITGKQLESLKGGRLLVVGDLILDRYTWGVAERVSPEAPVLVLAADQREVRAERPAWRCSCGIWVRR